MVLFTINIFWLATLLYDRACRLRGHRAGHEALPRPARRTTIRRLLFQARPRSSSAPTTRPPPGYLAMAVATMRSIAKLGKQEHFDLFILSDTTDPDIWVHEEAAFQAVREREELGSRIFYRRRSANTGKKAGNVADWCRRWGANYEYMLVLDADSLMTGEAVVKLAPDHRKEPGFRARADRADFNRAQHAVRAGCSNSPGGYTARCWRRGSRSGTGASAISGGIMPSSGPAPLSKARGFRSCPANRLSAGKS